ncbi:hypothetical protein NDU88_003718 [Pleurodeles waltl]|uniref:Uncharacterized protein n=1 Tax=Pleurodeles waltl TaxID=8319 RepID=A0AAV7REQ0_PLEWA|nr:hypothetical protein NDU88_003718 [Pleurodeles waltl]
MRTQGEVKCRAPNGTKKKPQEQGRAEKQKPCPGGRRQEGHLSPTGVQDPKMPNQREGNHETTEKEKSGTAATSRNTQEPKPIACRLKHHRSTSRNRGSPPHRSPCHTKTRQRASTEPEWKRKNLRHRQAALTLGSTNQEAGKRTSRARAATTATEGGSQASPFLLAPSAQLPVAQLAGRWKTPNCYQRPLKLTWQPSREGPRTAPYHPRDFCPTKEPHDTAEGTRTAPGRYKGPPYFPTRARPVATVRQTAALPQ